jgi:redox-sensing transcriptional repressor
MRPLWCYLELKKAWNRVRFSNQIIKGVRMMDEESNFRTKNQKEGIPYATIKRLPVYYRFLNDLVKKEVERVSSRELAVKMGINPSQLRQDLSYFGSFGQQGYGYRVHDLLQEIGKILGLNQQLKMVLTGAGHLGMALANYDSFIRRGFIITAIFDNNPEIIGDNINGIFIQSIKALHDYLRANIIDVGIITTPAEPAQEIADQLIADGVKGIWNFAPVSLKIPEGVIVENVHISESLFLLSFKLQQKSSRN